MKLDAARKHDPDSVSSTGPSFDQQLFEPYERMLLLSIMTEDIPESTERAAIVAVIRACFATIKQMQGRETRQEAYRVIELARLAILELRAKT